LGVLRSSRTPRTRRRATFSDRQSGRWWTSSAFGCRSRGSTRQNSRRLSSALRSFETETELDHIKALLSELQDSVTNLNYKDISTTWISFLELKKNLKGEMSLRVSKILSMEQDDDDETAGTRIAKLRQLHGTVGSDQHDVQILRVLGKLMKDQNYIKRKQIEKERWR